MVGERDATASTCRDLIDATPVTGSILVSRKRTALRIVLGQGPPQADDFEPGEVDVIRGRGQNAKRSERISFPSLLTAEHM